MSDFEARYPMVRVEWEDSSILPRGWTDMEVLKLEKPVVGVTVGFLVRNDEVAVTVIQSLGMEENGDGLCGLVIPRSAVRKVDYLRNDGRPEPPPESEELGPFTMERATNGFTGEVVPTVGGFLHIGGKQYRITSVNGDSPKVAPELDGRERVLTVNPGESQQVGAFTVTGTPSEVKFEVDAADPAVLSETLWLGGKAYRITPSGSVEAVPPVGPHPPLLPDGIVYDRLTEKSYPISSIPEEVAPEPPSEPAPDRVEPSKRGFFSFLPWAGG